MTQEAKKYIQNAAWTRFPAQELWIRPDNHFWAFDINDDEVSFTEGEFTNGDIIFHTTVHPTTNGELYVEPFVEVKRSNGYECFAIQLRE